MALKEISLSRGRTIPESELAENFSPSGGPGGQHANRSSTGVWLEWSFEDSAILSDAEKERLRESEELPADAKRRGVIRVKAEDERSQIRNRETARERMEALITAGLKIRRKRKPSRVPKGAVERRLEEKKKKGEKKQRRKQGGEDQDW